MLESPAVIDRSKCTSCLRCIEECKKGAFFLNDEIVQGAFVVDVVCSVIVFRECLGKYNCGRCLVFCRPCCITLMKD